MLNVRNRFLRRRYTRYFLPGSVIAFAGVVFSIFSACGVDGRGRDGEQELSVVFPVKASIPVNKIGAEAISVYLEAVKQSGLPSPDTLFLGRNPDFPEVTLPDAMYHTRIVVLPEDKTDSCRLSYRLTSPYINLMGWINRETAEFLFITFYPGFQHQYDHRIIFQRNTVENGFSLSNVQMEDYRAVGVAADPKRTCLYKNDF